MHSIEDIALTMIPDCGCRTVAHLLSIFGSAEAVFTASREQLIVQAELKPQLADRILGRISFARAEQEIKYLAQRGLDFISSDDPRYPQRMLECDDYPHVIYTQGSCDLNQRHLLAVVGTRRITTYGQRICDNIITELAALLPDTVIVSGLALGTDITAHKAALRNGLKTIAVQGRNMSAIYPVCHTNWAANIVAQGGMVLSEYTSSDNPDKSSFVQRNRIIAGMCDATLIIESASRGGSLHTATLADGYNRTVLAVPGRVGDTYSEGTNALIADHKAEMIRSAEDILNTLMWGKANEYTATQGDIFAAAISSLDEQTQMVYKHINYEPTDGDILASSCHIDQPTLARILLDLQFAGLIRAVSSNRYIRL